MLIALCVLSLVVGNVVAIAQTNLKRMLAYSTISHVGFIFMGFIAGTPNGVRAAMFYTFAYVLMAAAAFGMIILLSRRGFEAERLEDFKGLNARSPWFASMMLMVMFSLAGVPPFIGFYAKLVVLGACSTPGLAWLAGVGVLFAVIGAFYYIRVVWYMYFADRGGPRAARGGDRHADRRERERTGLLALGVFPGGSWISARGCSASPSLPCGPSEGPVSCLALSGAGWSSLVARRAHNPKVVGSNPTPATKQICWGAPATRMRACSALWPVAQLHGGLGLRTHLRGERLGTH